MFGKTETRAALDVAMEINKDDTDRCCSFSLTGTTDAISLFVYPDSNKLDDSYGYIAYQTGRLPSTIILTGATALTVYNFV